MKRNGSVAFVIGLFFLSSFAFAQEDGVVKANNQFAFDLYSQYKSKKGNIFYSPYSISSALAMCYEGAKGKTEEEMQAVFHFPQDASLRRESFFKTNQALNEKDKNYKLNIANALWAQKDYKFLTDYLGLVEKYYGGKATSLDFAKNAEKARLTINGWVEQKTNKKIKNLIPEGMLTPLTRMVLTNAIYFKSFWFKPFTKSYTKENDFWINENDKIQAPMMRLFSERFNYAETDMFQLLELPYKGEKLSMFILLPQKGGLKVLEEALNAERLSEWKRLLKNEKADVYLPKFKFETKYFMAQDLKPMGMLAAFTLGVDFGGAADFSGMTGDKKLNIDEVIHQAFVDVDEEGTEAAAATAVVMGTMASAPGAPEPIKVFKADHPFLFIIQDKDTGNILFMGRVSDPTK